MNQLTFAFTGTRQPVDDKLRNEYPKLKRTPMRCLDDLRQQLTRARMASYMLQLRSEKLLRQWRVEGMPMYDPKRDKALQEIAEQMIIYDAAADDLECQIQERERFEYLKSFMG